MLKNKIYRFFLSSVVLTVLLSIFIYGRLTLLHLINISFYISATLLFVSLLTITVKGGFFDGITYGFRRMFRVKGKELTKVEVNEMIPVSELFSLDHKPLFITGLLMTVLMLAGLFIYYL